MFFNEPRHSPIPCLAFMLFILMLSNLAFCGEIHDAASQGDLEKVKSLLKTNPELVYNKDDNGWTPLHDAAAKGHKDVVALLLANGAEVNAKKWDRTPLHEAVVNGHKDVAELLLANGAEVNARGHRGFTPLEWSIRTKGEKTMVDLLIANGADVNARDNQGDSPLHAVACNDRTEEIGILLLAKGAEVNAKNKSGFTPLHYASWGHKNIVKLLLSKGADINAKDNNDTTPLHEATLRGRRDIVELLLANGADVNAQDKFGHTPLYQAERRSNEDMAELLRQHGALKASAGKTSNDVRITRIRPVDKVRCTLKDVEVTKLAKLFQELTKKPHVVEAGGSRLIDFNTGDDLSIEEAHRMFISALLKLGYKITDDGDAMHICGSDQNAP